MKKFLLLMVMAFVCLGFGSSNPITKDGYYKGVRLCGRVKVVKVFGDFKVREVGALSDLKVVKVKSIPTCVGEWQIVDCCEDFSVEFVSCGEDFTVSFVNNLPGVR